MRRLRIPLALFVLGAALVPFFTVQIVPEWHLRVADEKGQPLPGLVLTQRWRHYSLEFWRGEDHVEDVTTDELGNVRFPERRISISGVQYLAAKARDLLVSWNPHSSRGPSSYVLCRGPVSCQVAFDPGQLPPANVTAAY